MKLLFELLTERLKRYEVLPTTEYPAEQYQILLDQDLKEGIAFVQLIGPYAWERGGFDRIQNEAAATLGIPRFRYRSSEIDLEKVEPSQREFLTAADVIASVLSSMSLA